MNRAMVFVDGNNFYHACKNYLKQNPGFDYVKLTERIIQKVNTNHPVLPLTLLRTFFYTVNEPTQQGLVSALSSKPQFTVNNEGFLKKKQIPNIAFDPNNPSTYVVEEKGTDVNLATGLLRGAYMNSYEVAIIVSADSDYITPVREIQNLGKIVILVTTANQPIVPEYRKVVDHIIQLDETDFSSCWRGTYVSKRATTPTVSSTP